MGDQLLEPSNLQETLEAEFCPPLDTTIVAILLADYISGEKPTEAILKTLREQLSELAASAAVDQDDLANDLHGLQLSAPSATTEESRDGDSVFSQNGLETSSNSGSSASPPSEVASPTQMHSALAFLQASFPYLSSKRLKACLDDAELDMEKVVEDLLSEEYVRELEERGLEDEALEEEMENWTVVSRKSRTPSSSSALILNKKRKAKGKTIAINDIRQKQHVRPASQIHSANDPWNQIASISAYLETLLARPSSFFHSYFHKPEYSSPSTALRAALNSIDQQVKELKEKSVSENEEDRTTALFTLLEFISASPDYDYKNLDSEARAQLCADAELSLAAAGGSPDVALDIVKLLYELETDNESTQEMGVYHSPASPLPTSGSLPSSSSQSSPTFRIVASGVSPLSPSISSTISPVPPSVAPKQRPPPAPSQSAWQQVAPARPKAPAVHPLAAHIPAYNPHNVPRRKPRSTHPSLTKPAAYYTGSSWTTNGSRSPSQTVLGGYKTRIDACHARRDEALRTASRHWTGGGARGRGGEVAFFYAQEAQQYQAEARRLQLDAVREHVHGKRYKTTDTDTIDVHYCTTSEALTIVQEVLDEGWVSPARPLRVITGRGTHSSGGLAVLGPAVKKALERDGWVVGKSEGWISVRGRVR